jgi:hypothetical protein
MEKNELTATLLRLAEAEATEAYGCGLERLDPSEVEWYEAQLTARPWMLDELVGDLAAAAWQAY